MKRLFSTLLLGGLVSMAALAQNATLTPSSVTLNPTSAETDVHGTLVLHNPAASAKTFKWERTVVSISPGGQTQVCDPNACYLPSVSSKQFTIAANTSVNMQVHFLNFSGVTGCATVHLKITEVGNDDNTVTGIYLFNDCALVLDDDEALAAASIRLFPNPTVDVFMLENIDNVDVVRVFGMDGREAKQFQALPNGSYSVADLAVGNYIVVLQDRNGKAVKSLELRKN
jgi:hypothetical protein